MKLIIRCWINERRIIDLIRRGIEEKLRKGSTYDQRYTKGWNETYFKIYACIKIVVKGKTGILWFVAALVHLIKNKKK